MSGVFQTSQEIRIYEDFNYFAKFTMNTMAVKAIFAEIQESG